MAGEMSCVWFSACLVPHEGACGGTRRTTTGGTPYCARALGGGGRRRKERAHEERAAVQKGWRGVSIDFARMFWRSGKGIARPRQQETHVSLGVVTLLQRRGLAASLFADVRIVPARVRRRAGSLIQLAGPGAAIDADAPALRVRGTLRLARRDVEPVGHLPDLVPVTRAPALLRPRRAPARRRRRRDPARRLTQRHSAVPLARGGARGGGLVAVVPHVRRCRPRGRRSRRRRLRRARRRRRRVRGRRRRWRRRAWRHRRR